MCPPTPPTHTFSFYQKREQELPIKRHHVIRHNWKADVKDVKKEEKINCENSQTMVIIILAAQGGLWRGLSGLMSVITLGKTRKLGEGMRCAYYRAVMMAKISIDNMRM